MITKETWDAQPWADENDSQIGRRLSVSREAVRKQRLLRGHPPKRRVKKPPPPPKIHGYDWDNETRLGQMFDIDLAQLLGCHITTVIRARRARKIRCFRSTAQASGRRSGRRATGKAASAGRKTKVRRKQK